MTIVDLMFDAKGNRVESAEKARLIIRNEYSENGALLGMRYLVAKERHYSDSQPRVPAGSSDGGQWTSGGGGAPAMDESVRDWIGGLPVRGKFKSGVTMKGETKKMLAPFGVNEKNIAGIVGVPPGLAAEVVALDPDYGSAAAEVLVRGEGWKALYRIYDGKTIENVQIEVMDKGKGLGTRMLATQVRSAAAAGFASIDLYAAGGYDPTGAVAQPGSYDALANGYYTWARLGFDGPIDKWTKQYGTKNGATLFASAERVSDLMKSAEGRAQWKKWGAGMDLKFDLTPGSLSRRILDEYLKEKGL